MSYSNVTCYLLDAAKTNVSFTLTTSNYPDAAQFMQTIVKSGGITDSSGNFYPASAIWKISVA